MPLDYESCPAPRVSPERLIYLYLLKSLTACFLLSILTLPSVNALWLGELPVLALIQVPKVTFANWLRTDIVMPAIRMLGLSRGSFSPDYIVARPYALTIAYVIPLAVLLLTVAVRTRLANPYRRWSLILLAAATVDFLMTLIFASSRSLTIY